ncbi:protein-tyrosine-phosphatase [Myroides odoratimimus]|uniref:protein-tyrosine-phosphatase n=1 Tax=Myroides odoratimimus TaxID=76832 RepID=UPI00257528D9|nr:protein-tyrosine-phosphatase [Myroides odoratimimus]MDM1039069.1 protein-tyrosine-phosphatase [Myroides odoratimimus]MDM1053191.1 protein-tyrosine-phosphatase [Myroides odoratimimus]
MFPELVHTIKEIEQGSISNDRKNILQPLVEFIQKKTDHKKNVNLNFICTHNSRRSHLAQIWAQIAASYYNVSGITTYSGGTEETALFPKIVETLSNQGVRILKIAEDANPVYAIKYSDNDLPIIGFSKKYDNPFNPISGFAAIMTCSQADGGCPFIAGAEKRIPITFEDPKESDGKDNQKEVYFNRSLEIAKEMFYVFSQIKK